MKLKDIEKLLRGKDKKEEQYQELVDAIAGDDAEIVSYNKNKRNIMRLIDSANEQITEQEKLMDIAYADMIEENVNKVRDIVDMIQDTEKDITVLNTEIDKYSFWVNAFGKV